MVPAKYTIEWVGRERESWRELKYICKAATKLNESPDIGTKPGTKDFHFQINAYHQLLCIIYRPHSAHKYIHTQLKLSVILSHFGFTLFCVCFVAMLLIAELVEIMSMVFIFRCECQRTNETGGRNEDGIYVFLVNFINVLRCLSHCVARPPEYRT